MSTQTLSLNSVKGFPNGFFLDNNKAFAITIAAGEKKATLEIEWEIITRSSILKPVYLGKKFFFWLYQINI